MVLQTEQSIHEYTSLYIVSIQNSHYMSWIKETEQIKTGDIPNPQCLLFRRVNANEGYKTQSMTYYPKLFKCCEKRWVDIPKGKAITVLLLERDCYKATLISHTRSLQLLWFITSKEQGTGIHENKWNLAAIAVFPSKPRGTFSSLGSIEFPTFSFWATNEQSNSLHLWGLNSHIYLCFTYKFQEKNQSSVTHHPSLTLWTIDTLFIVCRFIIEKFPD